MKPKTATRRLVSETWTTQPNASGDRWGRRIYLYQQKNGKWILQVLRTHQWSDGRIQEGGGVYSRKGGSMKVPIDSDAVDGILDALIMAKDFMARGVNLEDA